MFRKVNAREKPIGFYHTGPTLRSSDLEISELFKRFVPKPVSLSLPPPPSSFFHVWSLGQAMWTWS